MAIAGRVAIVPKGDWSADATYKRLDAVTYNNTLYFAKKDVPAGTATTNTEYWSKSIVGNPDKSSDQQGQNLISYPYYSKSNTNNGITWTVNDDGTVTANGTATKESTFNIISPFDAKSRKTLELNQKYVLSDGTSDKTKAYTQFVRFNASKNTYDYGINSRTGYNTWTASDENLLSYGIRLIVANGATVNNVVFKPMLEIGTVMHEYQPTTISNTTLGEKVNSFKQYEPDGKSMSVDDSGTLSINLDGATITLDEAKNVIKLADTLKDKINGAFPAANLINNLTTTEAGFGLDARQGKALDDKITEINGSLNKYDIDISNLFSCNANAWITATYHQLSKIVEIHLTLMDPNGFKNGTVAITLPDNYQPDGLGFYSGHGSGIINSTVVHILPKLTSPTLITIWFSEDITLTTMGCSMIYKIT